MTAPTRPITIVPEPPIVDPQSFVPVMPEKAFVITPDTIVTGPIIKRPVNDKGPDIPSEPTKADYYALAVEANPDIFPADGLENGWLVIIFPTTGHRVVAQGYQDITMAYLAQIASEAPIVEVPLGRATLPTNESQSG